MRFKNLRKTEHGTMLTWSDAIADFEAYIEDDDTVHVYHYENSEPYQSMHHISDDAERRRLTQLVFDTHFKKYMDSLKRQRRAKERKISNNTWYNDMSETERKEFIMRLAPKACDIIDITNAESPNNMLIRSGYYDNLKSRVKVMQYNLEPIPSKYLSVIPRYDKETKTLTGCNVFIVKLIGHIFKSPNTRKAVNSVRL